MKRIFAFFVGLGVSSCVFAGVPALTDIPLTAQSKTTFLAGEEKELSFSVAMSADTSGFGAASRQLAGCQLKVTAKFLANSERLVGKGLTLQCPKSAGPEAITGYLVGADHVAGLHLTCKGNPQCTGALALGAAGFFVLMKDFGK
jgi:hypothetical protein